MFTDQKRQSTAQFIATDYPRTYVASGANKFGAILVALLVSGGAAVALSNVAMHLDADTSMAWALPAALMLPILIFPLLILATFRFRIVLQPDRIDYRGLFDGWSVRRDQIGNWRMPVIKRGKVLELTSIEPGAPARKCMLQCEVDAAFEAWFAGLPNSDLLAQQQAEEAIRQNPAYGGTPEERINAAARSRKVAAAATFAACSCTMWAMIYPAPFMLPVWACLALPWIALALCRQGKGRYSMGNINKKTATSDLTALILLPGFALAVAVAQDGTMLDWSQAIIPGIGVALVLALLVAWTNDRVGKALICLPPALLYGVSATLTVNRLFDDRAPVAYPVRILEHWQVRGKGVSSHLRISAWGPHSSGDEMVVDYALYEGKSNGDVVCLRLHGGAFKMPWYTLDECSPGEAPEDKTMKEDQAKPQSRTDTPTAAPAAVAAASGADAAKKRQAVTAPTLALLNADAFQELDKRLSAQQRAFEQGHPGAEDDLFESMGQIEALDTRNAFIEQKLDAWVKALPQSYVAHLARATFYLEKASDARGSAYYADTRPDQIEAMNHWLAISREELQRSKTLTAKPFLSHLTMLTHLLRDNRQNGQGQDYDAALRMAPKSMLLHRTALDALTPRWGGSYGAMRSYIDTNAKWLSPADINQLESIIREDQAGWLADGTRDDALKESMDFYTKAIALDDRARYHCAVARLQVKMHRVPDAMSNMQLALNNPNRTPAHSGFCRSVAGWIARTDSNAPGIVPLLDGFLEEVQYDTDLLDQRGWIHQQRGEKAAAYADYKASAAMDDDWATLMQARYVFNGWGGAIADREAGLALFRRAADMGNVEAQHCVADALNRMGRPDEARKAEQQYAGQRANKDGQPAGGIVSAIGEFIARLLH